MRRPSLALVLKREDEMKADYFILSIVTSRSSHSEGCEGRVRDGKEKLALGGEEDVRRNGTKSPRCCSVPLPECPEHSRRKTLQRKL